jgi:hypothetical protein
MKFKHFAIVTGLLISAAATLSDPASASHYRSSGGSTYLDIKEVIGSSGFGNGYYFTTINGTQWGGNFNTSSSGPASYSGTFNDFAMGGINPPQGCSGNINIVRTLNSSNNFIATVTWTITGGTNCPSPIGSTQQLILNEAVPVVSGNITASQANTVMSQTAGLATWPSWRVVDTTPLNCRQSPTSSNILATFPTGTILNARYLGLNGIVMSGGVPWMHVRYNGNQNQYCVVRAHTNRIVPRKLPY